MGDQPSTSGSTSEEQCDGPEDLIAEDLIVPESVCAILASQGTENFYLVKIIKTFELDHDITDKFNHTIPAGIAAIEVVYLEIHSDNPMKGTTYSLGTDKVFIYKEDIVYPAVGVTKKGNKYFLSNVNKTEINYFFESHGLVN